MKGKVKCTCGWSWNKSDSSKKDMYICHECGRDNSNNMKNGGEIPIAQKGAKKFKVKDERLEGQVTKDNLEDRNVFSQNQLSLKKPVVQKQIKRTQKEAANPKVVIFAESPEIKKYKWNEVKDADEFYDPNLNPTIGRDSTFIKEAQNVKDFYERTDPNVKVNIVPLYGDKKVMQEKLKRMTPFDKFAIFGHFGDRLAGIPNSEIAKYLSDSRVNDCYFGSCGFENEINKSALKNLSGKTLNYRPSGNYWWGFDPNAKTFDEGMWSRTGEQADAVKIIPIKEGVTHKIKKSKDGGWLDNYNDSKASAPEGMVGDGFSNVGRNYSPAWGGQFEEGGEIPKAQGGRATRADSLAVLNSQLALNKFYDKELKAGRLKKDKFPVPPSTDRFKNSIKNLNKENLGFYREQIKLRADNPYGNNQGTYDDQYKRIFNLTPREVKKLEEQGLIKSKSNTNNKAYYRDMITPMQNLQAPFALIDSRIIPQGQVDYRPYNQNYPGGDVTVYDYDPLAVTPFDMLTDAQKKERVKKYGTDGVPKSYIDKLKPEDKADKVDKQRPKVEALQPLTQQGINSDFSIDAQLPVIRSEARIPKSFDVNSQRQTMSGPSDYYNYSDEGVDISDAVRAKESADAYNQYIQEKYEEAAKTNPKAQKRLEQLMQNVELTPNYQMGGNVYPVNYVPQAQEGETMFKKPSILQQEYIDPIYSYSERTKLYPGEEKKFKERPDVAGMATEDNRVIINPWSPISKEMKDLVRTNETARLAMLNGYPRPTFELTPKQQEFFNTIQNGNPYSEDLQDIKETIAARVMTGDDSAQDYTKEQELYADKLFDVLKKSKDYATGMSGMMKSKIGMGNAFEHPAIKRMSQAMPKTGMTPEGTGTHYMSSVDNYAVPELQDLGEEELTLVDPDSRSREAIRFNSPEEANYFAEHYKDVAPMSTTFRDLNSFQTGGSIPGSVGFTYARTKGIPSNGPYAKKTMASAKNGGWLDAYKEGGIIRDDRGQWAHPGEITEIGSNDITMEGVPYDVLGISDTGDTKLMKPGKNYKFKGKKVTEFPMAKNGLRQEQKGLVNLDQLTNFTNYNKPQPGGWLNKYN